MQVKNGEEVMLFKYCDPIVSGCRESLHRKVARKKGTNENSGLPGTKILGCLEAPSRKKLRGIAICRDPIKIIRLSNIKSRKMFEEKSKKKFCEKCSLERGGGSGATIFAEQNGDTGEKVSKNSMKNIGLMYDHPKIKFKKKSKGKSGEKSSQESDGGSRAPKRMRKLK